MSQIKLPQNMIQYFSLFLVKREEDVDLAGMYVYTAFYQQ
jgi:hypothetical protein